MLESSPQGLPYGGKSVPKGIPYVSSVERMAARISNFTPVVFLFIWTGVVLFLSGGTFSFWAKIY